MKGDAYDQTLIPVAWRSWMAHRRPDPPTMQELLAEDQRRLMIQDRARQLDLAWVTRKKELSGSTSTAMHAVEEGKSPSTPQKPRFQPLSKTKDAGTSTTTEKGEDSQTNKAPDNHSAKRVTSFDPRKDQYQPEAWTPIGAKRRE